MTVKKLSTGRYQVRWRDGGGLQRAKNFRSKDAAVYFERQLIVQQETTGLPVTPSGMTFGEFADRWHADYSKVQKAETTAKEDEDAIRVHLKPALSELRLGELRKKHLLEFQAAMTKKVGRHKRPLSVNTVNNIVALAKSMLNTAVDWELIPANPWSKVKRLKPAAQGFDFWMPEERDLFVQRCRAHDEAFAELVLVAAHTGLRKGELWGLRRSQLDFSQGLIRVDASTSSRLRKRQGRTKNGEVAFVRMDDVVYRCLLNRKLAAADTPVFDQRLFADLRHRFTRLCKRVGSRPIRWHDLRHTYASCLVMAGVPLYTVKELMRHKQLSQTERYAHLAPDYLREAANALVSASSVHSSFGGLKTAEISMR